MASQSSQFVEKFTQCLTSILGEPSVRMLMENHLNRSVDSLDKTNLDSLDKHIGALSERSASEMIHKFPSMLQERIQSPTIRDTPALDEGVARRTSSKHSTERSSGETETRYFQGRNLDGDFRTRSPFSGSQGSTLVPQGQDPYQRQRNHYSANTQANQGDDPPNSSFIRGIRSPAHSRLNRISELGNKDPESNRKAAQVIEGESPLASPAISYSERPVGMATRTSASFHSPPSSQSQILSTPTRSSTPTQETKSGVPPRENRHVNIYERTPVNGTSESQYEERPSSPESLTSEERPLTPLSDNSEQIYAEVTKSPQKSQDYLSKTIENTGLTGFYGKDHPRVKAVAANAAARAAEIANKYQLTPKTALGVIKLALYNFVVLCDDSQSMRREQRIPALKTTLNRVADIATLLLETGISIRFLNYNQDSMLDDLRQASTIMEKIASVRFMGITMLGTVLEKKIIKPMILDKAARKALEAPLVVVIITDGEGENRETLRDKIRECKRKLSETDLGDGSVVFIISRVGGSTKAEGFIDELENSPGMEQMVYCSKDRLDEKMAILQRAAGDTAYTRHLIELFVAALDNQAG
ncbi:hypothetical protein AYO22_07658 [Fonsecaea multimorphosa]|nr:hypothetical protein AYO22_07658 [Fonsecaea multimorphosa]